MAANDKQDAGAAADRWAYAHQRNAADHDAAALAASYRRSALFRTARCAANVFLVCLGQGPRTIWSPSMWAVAHKEPARTRGKGS